MNMCTVFMWWSIPFCMIMGSALHAADQDVASLVSELVEQFDVVLKSLSGPSQPSLVVSGGRRPAMLGALPKGSGAITGAAGAILRQDWEPKIAKNPLVAAWYRMLKQMELGNPFRSHAAGVAALLPEIWKIIAPAGKPSGNSNQRKAIETAVQDGRLSFEKLYGTLRQTQQGALLASRETLPNPLEYVLRDVEQWSFEIDYERMAKSLAPEDLAEVWSEVLGETGPGESFGIGGPFASLRQKIWRVLAPAASEPRSVAARNKALRMAAQTGYLKADFLLKTLSDSATWKLLGFVAQELHEYQKEEEIAEATAQIERVIGPAGYGSDSDDDEENIYKD